MPVSAGLTNGQGEPDSAIGAFDVRAHVDGVLLNGPDLSVVLAWRDGGDHARGGRHGHRGNGRGKDRGEKHAGKKDGDRDGRGYQSRDHRDRDHHREGTKDHHHGGNGDTGGGTGGTGGNGNGDTGGGNGGNGNGGNGGGNGGNGDTGNGDGGNGGNGDTGGGNGGNGGGTDIGARGDVQLALFPLQVSSQCSGAATFQERYHSLRLTRADASVCLAAGGLGAFADDRVSMVDVADAVLNALTTPLARSETRRAALEAPASGEVRVLPAIAPNVQQYSVLEDPDPRNRRRAASAIGRMNAALDTAIPTVLSALCTKDARVRRRAERIATGIGRYAEDASPALAERIANDGNSEVTRAAVQSLSALGVYATAALPTLIGILDNNDLGVRYYAGDGINNVDGQMTKTLEAIQTIANRCYDDWGGPLQVMADRLEEDRVALRERASQSLANIGTKAMAEVPAWSAALEQRQLDERERAVHGLSDATRFSSAAVNALTRVGSVPGTGLEMAVGAGPLAAAASDDDQDIRQVAVAALGETNKEVNDAWIALEQAPKYDLAARRATKRALQTIDAYKGLAVSALLAAVKDDDPEAQRSAVQAMAALKGQAGEAIPALVDAVESGPAAVRSEAALALGQIGGAPADGREHRGLIVPTLVGALDDPDPLVRYHAAEALGLLGSKADTALPKLRALLQDDDVALRYQAAQALEAIAPETESGRVKQVDTMAEQEVAALLSAVKGEAPGTRDEAIRTLSNLGPGAITALPALAAELASAEPAARRPIARSLQAVSAHALDETPALIAALQAHGPEADRAAQALGDLGENANLAQGDLLQALNDPDPEVRLLVAEMLGDISRSMSAAVGALLVESLRNNWDAAAALQRVSG